MLIEALITRDGGHCLVALCRPGHAQRASTRTILLRRRCCVNPCSTTALCSGGTYDGRRAVAVDSGIPVG